MSSFRAEVAKTQRAVESGDADYNAKYSASDRATGESCDVQFERRRSRIIWSGELVWDAF